MSPGGDKIIFHDWKGFEKRREASKQAVRYTLILGEDEISQAKVAVRDMGGAEQVDVPTIDLVAWLKEKLSPCKSAF